MPSLRDDSAGTVLSLQQQRLWLLDQLTPGTSACNIAVRWKLIGPLDVEILEHAITEIVRRHESLRTKFVLEDYSPVQMVEPEVEAALTVIDLTHTAATQREAEVERLCSSEAQLPFELLRAPLFRVTLIRVDEQTHWLLLTVHHIVADGWSIGVFVDELAALYTAYAANQPSPLAPPPLQYREYARRQLEGGRSNVSSPQLLYWLRQLKDLPRCEVPSDRPRPTVQSANGAIVSLLLPRALSEAVEKLARANGATLFMTSLAALTVLLQRYTGAGTVVMGTPVTGRNALELENLIGLFINLIVLRVDVSGDPSFRELLGRTRRVVLEGLANEEAPFEQLVDLLKPKRDLSRNPLFGVNFIFQRAFIREQPLGQARIIDVPSTSAGALYDLNFFMVGREEGWRVSCEFNTDLYEAATVQLMLERFRWLLETIVKAPERRISELSWAGAEAAQRRVGPEIEAAAASEVAPRPAVAAQRATRVDDIPVGFTATIACLIPLWEEVLGIHPVGQEDDFFELGGNSIQAARLMAKVNSALGRKLPLAVVIRSSTPARLARELEAPQALEGSRVLALQPRGRGTPFFIVNAYSGFVEVARKVDADHPILNLIGDDDKALSGNYDLDEEVSEHVSTILATQPAGPYMLGGYSAGGILAYEVAQRLTALGHEVALLVLFDIANPAYTRDASRLGMARARLLESLDFHCAQLRQRPRRGWPGYLIGCGLVGMRRALKGLARLGRRQAPAVTLAPVGFEMRIQAARRYRPQPYDGPVLFFKLPSDRLSGRYRDRIYGWGSVITGDFEVCTVEARDHLRIFSDAAGDKVARKLEHRLREVVSHAAESSEGHRGAEDGLRP